MVWRRFVALATTGPAWPLSVFLAISFLLRMPAVLCADGYEFLDQQFQYVDPAWHLASGDAWIETWEWQGGVRSWVYPGFLAVVFRGWLLLGLDEPMWLMRGVRAVHALVSLLPVWLFWLCIVRWRPIANPRLPLLLFAGSGLLVTLGVQPSGLAFGGTLAIAAVLAFHGPRWFPALSGILLGLAFCGRFQDALFGPALFAVGLAQRRFRACVWLVLGCVPGLLLQGEVDRQTWGTFFSSPWTYVTANLVEGKAAGWSTKPWWFYFAVGVVPLAMLVPPWWGCAWRRLRLGAAVLPAAAAAAAFHLVAHSFIARKALRFEYSALGLLVAVVAAGLGAQAAAERWSTLHRRGVVFAQVLLWLWASFLFGHAGPVRVAMALHAEQAFDGELLVVGGEATSVGGAYYLREQRLHVVCVPREDLRAHLQNTPAKHIFLVAVKEDLDPGKLEGLGQLTPIGRYMDAFDRREGDRRFLYSLVR